MEEEVKAVVTAGGGTEEGERAEEARVAAVWAGVKVEDSVVEDRVGAVQAGVTGEAMGVEEMVVVRVLVESAEVKVDRQQFDRRSSEPSALSFHLRNSSCEYFHLGQLRTCFELHHAHMPPTPRRSDRRSHIPFQRQQATLLMYTVWHHVLHRKP